MEAVQTCSTAKQAPMEIERKLSQNSSRLTLRSIHTTKSNKAIYAQALRYEYGKWTMLIFLLTKAPGLWRIRNTKCR